MCLTRFRGGCGADPKQIWVKLLVVTNLGLGYCAKGATTQQQTHQLMEFNIYAMTLTCMHLLVHDCNEDVVFLTG